MGYIVSVRIIGFVFFLPTIFNVGITFGRMPPWFSCGGIIVGWVWVGVNHQQRRVLSVTLLTVTSVVSWLCFFGNPMVASFTSCLALKFRLGSSGLTSYFMRIYRYIVNPVSTIHAMPVSQRRLTAIKMLVVSAVVYWLCYLANPRIIWPSRRICFGRLRGEAVGAGDIFLRVLH